MNFFSGRIYRLNYRNRKSKHKKLVSNTIKSANWEDVQDNIRKKVLVKYPKVKISRKSKVTSVSKRVKFYAPTSINYYSKKEFEITNKFIIDIRDCALKGYKVFIDFSRTKKISAAAMLSFLAEVDVLIKKSQHGTHTISFSHPKEEKIESILVQVGFYDLLKKNKRETKSYDDVTFWKYTSGICSEPLLAKEMIVEIKKELEKVATRKLYRGFIEAMSNSVEHAYLDDNEHSEEEKTAKWWTFAGIKDNQLTIVICDKGVGIPATLPRTQGVSTLKSLLFKIGVKSIHNVKDSAYIKASTSLFETRTGERNRGKGLNDIKSVIDSIGEGFMGIFSNNGRYIYKG